MMTFTKTGSAILAAAILSACGGGGSDGPIATGGISGTGSGTITGFGSVILNDRGKFETESAEVEIDGEAATVGELELGMVVQVDVANADDDFATGTASRVVANHEIKGPITSVNPLRVLGQDVVTNQATFFDNTTLATLIVGDEVEVAGHRDSEGVLLATRVEDKNLQLTEWKLSGEISSLATPTLFINDQPVDFSGATVKDCGAGLAVGVRVEIELPPMSSFSQGNTLTDVTEVECKPNVLRFGGNLAGTIQGEFEGFVTSVASASVTGDFFLGDQRVTRSASTTYEGGTPEDLVIGVKLDAKGLFDTQTQVLDATRIRFRETRFRIEGPATVLSADTVEVLGLTVALNRQTEVDSDVLLNEQVRVRGFVDTGDALIASEIDDRGDADLTDTRLRGPVSSINTAGGTFEILGVIIDGNSAASFAIEEALVTRGTFFAALVEGTEVDVEDGSFDSATTTLSNAKLTIENED